MKANSSLNSVAERFDTFISVVINCNKSKYCFDLHCFIRTIL